MTKTLVVGMFDAEADARRVLRQLAESPLDLRDVTVLHRDARLQGELQAAAGIPTDRSLVAAGAAGAVLGAAAGVLLTQVLPALGLALNAAAGAIVGALAAVLLAVAASPLKIPPEHQTALADGLEAGCTVVIVRTDTLPTAEAIGDLFRASNARDLGPAPSLGAAAANDRPDMPVATGDQAGPPPGGADAMFQPPERRAMETHGDG